MRLAELQSWFWDSLHGQETGDSAERVHGSERFSAQARMDWYAEMSRNRHLDALASEHPVLAALLGDAFGPAMVRYTHSVPTPHSTLGLRAEGLPAFLRQEGRAGAAGLAELEWAYNQAFVADDAAPLGVEMLSQLSPEAFMEARLTLVPSLKRLRLDVDPLPAWERFEAEADVQPELPVPIAQRTHLVVWRQAERVFHASLSPIEAMALERAAQGEPLAQVCEAFAEDPRGAGAAFQALAAWFNEGWVSGLQS